MKYSKKIITIAILLISSYVFAKGAIITTKFSVSGVCEMCEKRIEKAALIKGVKAASWNKNAQMLTLTYDESVVSILQVEKAIAAVGYDTKDIKATDKAYNNLHECCKYIRK